MGHLQDGFCPERVSGGGAVRYRPHHCQKNIRWEVSKEEVEAAAYVDSIIAVFGDLLLFFLLLCQINHSKVLVVMDVVFVANIVFFMYAIMKKLGSIVTVVIIFVENVAVITRNHSDTLAVASHTAYIFR